MNPYEKLNEMLRDYRKEKVRAMRELGFKRAFPNLKHDPVLDGPKAPGGYPLRYIQLTKLKVGKRWTCYNEHLDKPQKVKVIL